MFIYLQAKPLHKSLSRRCEQVRRGVKKREGKFFGSEGRERWRSRQRWQSRAAGPIHFTSLRKEKILIESVPWPSIMIYEVSYFLLRVNFYVLVLGRQKTSDEHWSMSQISSFTLRLHLFIPLPSKRASIFNASFRCARCGAPHDGATHCRRGNAHVREIARGTLLLSREECG